MYTCTIPACATRLPSTCALLTAVRPYCVRWMWFTARALQPANKYACELTFLPACNTTCTLLHTCTNPFRPPCHCRCNSEDAQTPSPVGPHQHTLCQEAHSTHKTQIPMGCPNLQEPPCPLMLSTCQPKHSTQSGPTTRRTLVCVFQQPVQQKPWLGILCRDICTVTPLLPLPACSACLAKLRQSEQNTPKPQTDGPSTSHTPQPFIAPVSQGPCCAAH